MDVWLEIDGVIAANNASLFNAELALAYGSFYAQSEVIYSVVDQQAGSSLTFPGAYLHAGYFLSGESRAYNGKNGVFGRVKPNCNVGNDGGVGAWEIAGRTLT
jgi:phosphate-selective porin OprO/OprP